MALIEIDLPYLVTQTALGEHAWSKTDAPMYKAGPITSKVELYRPCWLMVIFPNNLNKYSKETSPNHF